MKRLCLALLLLCLLLPAVTRAQVLEAAVDKIGSASSFAFDYEGGFLFAEKEADRYRIVKMIPGQEPVTLAERINFEISDIAYYKGVVYAANKTRIFKLAKGKLTEIISGLPANGDYGLGNLIFYNEHMYFSVGTATNSGIVGQDNAWLKSYPSIHDLVCQSIKLAGVNIETENFLTKKRNDKALTGSFNPFNTPVSKGEIIRPSVKCNGAVFRASLDGKNIELYAWGLHNPKGMSIDDSGNVWVLDAAMEDRGIRPVSGGLDALYKLEKGQWYGWPDFNAGKRIDQIALIADASDPPQPTQVYEPGAVKKFIGRGLVLASDHEVAELSLADGKLKGFASIEPAFGKIIAAKFGPDDNLYLLASNGEESKLLMAKIDRPIVLGSSIKRSMANNWSIGSLLAFAGLSALYFMRARFKPV